MFAWSISLILRGSLMLFGKLMRFGKHEPEKIKPDELEKLLNSLFEKKLDQFEPKAHAIINELKKSKLEFSEACNELKELKAEPYTEDIRPQTINFIKSQKGLYADALRRNISNMNLEPINALNSYEKYKLILSNVDKVTNEVLKSNANFKQAMYCYSDHLGNFKRSFSAIERLMEALRHEIESRSKEASEYAALKEHISKLNLQSDELEVLNQSANALREFLNNKDKDMVGKDESKLSESLSSKRSELSSVRSEISKLSERINLLTSPLERSAKKFDHVSAKKKQLHYFLEDPITRISNEFEYIEFMTLVKELKGAVEKGTIETKNKPGTTSLISALLDSDIYNIINSLKSLQLKRSEIENEINILEIALVDIKKGKDASSKAAQEIATIEERAKEITKSMTSTKSTIEAMFSDYYHKQMSIIS